ncbi:MAG: hypothetical protein AAF202_04280 [Pseudomonadota bacterium]
MRSKQRASLFYLCFLSVAYIAFGGWVTLDNQGALSAMALGWSSDAGLFELTSNYAGINLAVGLFCLYAICRPALRAHAFFPPMIINAGYLLGRTVALVTVGAPSAAILAAAIFEAIGLSVSVLGYRFQTLASQEDVV